MSVFGARARAQKNRSLQCSFFEGARTRTEHSVITFVALKCLYKSTYIHIFKLPGNSIRM